MRAYYFTAPCALMALPIALLCALVDGCLSTNTLRCAFATAGLAFRWLLAALATCYDKCIMDLAVSSKACMAGSGAIVDRCGSTELINVIPKAVLFHKGTGAVPSGGNLQPWVSLSCGAFAGQCHTNAGFFLSRPRPVAPFTCDFVHVAAKPARQGMVAGFFVVGPPYA
jgi:hypothetical protein